MGAFMGGNYGCIIREGHELIGKIAGRFIGEGF